MDSRPAPDSPCPRCGRALEHDRAVPLWDGRSYCEDCLESADPGLAGYASTHPVLEDSYVRDFDRAAYLRRARADALALLGVLLAPMVFLWWQSGWMPMAAAVLFGFWAILVGLILVPIHWYPNRLDQSRPTVRIRGGEVIVTRPWFGGGRIPERRAALTRCRWTLGRADHDQAHRGRGSVPGPPDEAIVLVLPGAPLGRYQVAFGSTAELRRRWAAFLRLSGVPPLR